MVTAFTEGYIQAMSVHSQVIDIHNRAVAAQGEVTGAHRADHMFRIELEAIWDALTLLADLHDDSKAVSSNTP